VISPASYLTTRAPVAGVQPVDAPEGEGIKNKPTDKEKDRQVFFMPPDEVSKPTISKPHQCSFHRILIRA